MRTYQSNKKPLKEIYLAAGLPVAETSGGDLVMALAADHLCWFEKTAQTAEALRQDLPARIQNQKIILVLSGVASPMALDGLRLLNIEVIGDGMSVVGGE
jgi:hypothetical protein